MTEGNGSKIVSRRTFLKKTASIGLGAVALSGLSACAGGAGSASATTQKWDEEYDVVVVGYGSAGATAAIVAHDKGSKVLIVEKMPVAGGTSAICGGAVWIPNTPMAKEAGIEDSREEVLTYMRLVAQGQADDELIVAYADRALEMYEYMTANTPFKLDFLVPLPDYHPEWDGGKAAGRTLTTSQYEGRSGGAALMAMLQAAITERGIQVKLNTPAKKLVTDETGGVVGLIVEQGGSPLSIRAKKGLILACGGFESDEVLKRHLLRGPTGPSCNVPGACTGDGLRMALAVGCDVSNLNECWGTPVYIDPNLKSAIPDYASQRGKPGAIMVNKYGKRFCNEASDYDTTWRSFFTWENFGATGYANVPGYMIMDHKHRSRYAIAGIAPGEEVPEWMFKSDTIRGIAEHFNIDADALEETVEGFNENAKNLVDPEFHRGESAFDTNWAGMDFSGQYPLTGPAACLGPVEEGPFYVLEIWPGDIGTCGGPRVNANAQVINPFGDVIKGLYAAGNASGIGAPGASYTGAGGTIGPAMVFGYIAGLDAASAES